MNKKFKRSNLNDITLKSGLLLLTLTSEKVSILNYDNVFIAFDVKNVNEYHIMYVEFFDSDFENIEKYCKKYSHLISHDFNKNKEIILQKIGRNF